MSNINKKVLTKTNWYTWGWGCGGRRWGKGALLPYVPRLLPTLLWTPGTQTAKGELQYSGYQCLSTVTLPPLEPSGRWHHYTSEDILSVPSPCSQWPISKTTSTMEKSVQLGPTLSLLGKDCRLLLGRESTLRSGPAPYKEPRLCDIWSLAQLCHILAVWV